jgi:hypothetical protein
MEDWFRSYDRMEIDLEEMVQLGGGVTFVVPVQKGRLAGSNAEVEVRTAGVIEWEDGLIESVTYYADIDEAPAGAERIAEERR